MAYTNPIDLGDGRFQFSDDAGQPVILPGTPSVLAQVAQMKAAPAQSDQRLAANTLRLPEQNMTAPDMVLPDQNMTAPPSFQIPEQRIDAAMPYQSPDAGFWRRAQSGVDNFKRNLVERSGIDRVDFGHTPGVDRVGHGGVTAPPQAQLTLPDQSITAEAPKPQQLIFAGGGGQQAQAPQQSPGRVIPGGFQPHSRSAQMQAPIPEEDLTDIKRGITGQMTANDAMGRTQAETANETAGEYQSQAAGLGQIQNDNAAREVQRQQRMDEAQAKFDQMNHALQGQHIDPAKAFRDESDADKFFTSLLVGLSTYGAGISHGDNTGLKLFRSRIDDSIAAQNKDLETQRVGVENQRGLVGMMREQFGDQRQAVAAARMAYLDMGKQKLAEIAARGLGTEGKMKLDAANAALQTDWAKEKAKFDQATAGVISQSDVYRPAQVVGGPAPVPFAKNDGSFVNLADGTSLRTGNPEQAGRVSEQLTGIGSVETVADDLDAELAKGPSAMNVPKVKMLTNLMATSVGQVKTGGTKMTGQGELDDLKEILNAGDHVTSDTFGRIRGAVHVVRSEASRIKRDIYNAHPRYGRVVDTKTGDAVRPRLPDAPPQREVRTQEVE